MPSQFDLTVNGRAVSVSVETEEMPLLNVLRNALGLTGTRFGCGLEQCGCCMVLIDGEPAKSCARPIWAVAGKSVTTIEGIGTPDAPHPLQQAFIEEQAGQCGYCLSGVLVTAKALLDRNASPSRAEIAQALDDNRILRAVAKAAARLREGADQ